MPVEFEHCRDGDTIVVSIPGSAFYWAVRLKDTWCPERGTTIGDKAKSFAAKHMAEIPGRLSRLHIPLPAGQNLLGSLSFDRVIGYLFLDEKTTLNELLVHAELASTAKGGKLGE